VKSVVFCVNMGKISVNFQPKAQVPQTKNKIFQKFLTTLLKLSYDNNESKIEDFFRIKSAGSSNYRGAAFFAFIRKSISNSKSERIALISGYPNNHYLLTSYSDNRYSIQSTNYYVRNYQRIMQNKPNLVRRRRIANESNYLYENELQKFYPAGRI